MVNNWHPKTPTSPNWHVIGEFGGKSEYGIETMKSLGQVVVISPGHEKGREAYDEAIKALCHDGYHNDFCVIRFYLSEDKTPSVSDLHNMALLDSRWQNYSPTVALYWRNEFTVTGCDRAGIGGEAGERAKIDYLCGEGVAEAFDAVSSLAVRASVAEYCGWGKTNDTALTIAYINNLPDPARRKQFQNEFNSLTQSRRSKPDDPNFCTIKRFEIEREAQKARRVLGF